MLCLCVLFILIKMAMNTQEIDKVLRRSDLTRSRYIGCFPADQIPPPNVRSPPYCMVVNTDIASGPGVHWVGVYVHATTVVDYFDSFADWPPRSAHIGAFLRQFPCVNRNPVCLQSDRSSACGKHAIYFLCRRCQGWPLQRIVRHLVACKTNPDRVVSSFAHKFIFDQSEGMRAHSHKWFIKVYI